MDPARLRHCRDLAEQNCNRGDLDCRWYHGNWALLKSLGLVATSAIHAEELRDLLLQALPAGKKNPAILISGSTDATLLEILHAACLDAGVLPDVTAVDVCDTPLELMAEYARRHGIAFSRARADILTYTSSTRYDVIFTHVFMGNFDEASRPALLHAWATLLADGGRVATVQRVRPGDSIPTARFTPNQSGQFVASALEAAASATHLPADELARVEGAATAFAENFHSHAINSREALEHLFEQAGFTFNYLKYQSLKTKSSMSGPSVPSGGHYAFIIAEKEATP
jgi:hypothetical protein